jgi:hypothetical protein
LNDLAQYLFGILILFRLGLFRLFVFGQRRTATRLGCYNNLFIIVCYQHTNRLFAAPLGFDLFDNLGSILANGFDFDGTNRQTVASGVSVLPATLSENNKYYYHFAPHSTGVALVRTKALTD